MKKTFCLHCKSYDSSIQELPHVLVTSDMCSRVEDGMFKGDITSDCSSDTNYKKYCVTKQQ